MKMNIKSTERQTITETPIVGMQCCGLPLYEQVVDWCAYRLLYTQYFDVQSHKKTEPVIETSTSIIEALQKAVGLGGGTWIPDAFKPYWMFNYFPSLTIELLKTIDGKVITEVVSKKILLLSAARLWNNNKKTGQLSLF